MQPGTIAVIDLPQVIDRSECLALPGFVLSTTGLIADGSPSFDQWQSVGQFLRYADGSLHWWIGDWLNYGERAYGEKYTQAMETTGFDYQTCADDKWVADKVEFSSRKENLSFAHHKAIAPLEPLDQTIFLETAEREGLTRDELRERVRDFRAGNALKLVAPPEDGCEVTDLLRLIDNGYRFGTIYADPPWKYDNQATRASTDNHYVTMSVEDIAALPIGKLAADNAHLHLWTTNAFLFKCPAIMEAWGFEYKSMFVWCKPQMGLGNYWRVATEIMLLGVRGSASFRDNGLINWAAIDRGEHSAKPEQIRHLIERASPGPYLELFGRDAVSGWAVWGNEISRDLFHQHLAAI